MEISQELQHLLNHVDQLKAELEGISISPQQEKILWEKFRLEWNYNSNHIEGNTLTYLETRKLLLRNLVSGEHTMRELEEMQQHDIAVQMVKEWAEDEREITEADIKNLNRLILVKPYWKEAITPDGQSTRREIQIGEYKKFPNSVRLGDGSIFEYETPENVPFRMQKLMDWFRNKHTALHPLVLAAEFHHRFILIHPFDDGNGRVARLLVNYILMRNSFQPVIIKSSQKTTYLQALQAADVGDPQPLYKYIADQELWSLQLAKKAARGEDIEEQGDVQKKIELKTRFFEALYASGQKKKLSKQVHEEITISSIIPLFQEIANRMFSFNYFFENPAIRVVIGGKNKAYIEKINFDFFIKNKQNWTVKHDSKIEYIANNYKHGNNNFFINYSVNIYYNPFTYEIEILAAGGLSTIRVEKQYTEPVLSQTEIMELAEEVQKRIFAELEEKS